ncbi:GspE/PulE family protein [Pseudomarimonas arenosa]|uniref:Type II/IV secretion system protein n=1 Tax=Pseudomarimonas arenosa TaxID=2774145 RepID=A0AAW3ZG26_9GAMM|nr:GspE/PulE family protein [Pseudomarimonas arenosa]MBD8525090.1 type II/IV secretion system protein [Pseudomarimonas arenosa]
MDKSSQIALLDNPTALQRYLERGQPPDSAPRLDRQAWCERVADEDAAQVFSAAEAIGLPLARLDGIEVDQAVLNLIPAERARQLSALPLLQHAKGLLVAVDNLSDASALAALDFLSQWPVSLVIATSSDIRNAIARLYDNAEDAEIARQLGLGGGKKIEDNPREYERLAQEKPTVKLIHGVMEQALYRRASDIHFRPNSKHLDLLYRIDDELVLVRSFLRELAPALVSRIKVLGKMNLAEHRQAQDGRTRLRTDEGKEIDLRISVMPTVHGESVVIRLLDTEQSLKTIDQIGLSPLDRDHMTDLLNRSHGLFLATGPTGCGKSTTLYAMLLELRKQNINILTIEDPVEYQIDDVQQMQVNRAAGFTFARALRNFLRHDPDAIMVGEIRDGETANVAVESSLTGHLVLSTLHTNTAATAVTRLLDLGVEPFLLRASLAAVMAQRLVRLNCAYCSQVEQIEPLIRKTLGVAEHETFYRGSGCSRCNGLGVFGRAAVYELLFISEPLRKRICHGAEADQIHQQAVAEGMVPITERAIEMARAGTISLTEAFRVRAV